MNGIISYTDNIIKYMSGKNRAGTNVETSDGKAVYITTTGVAKPYSSVRSLNNRNGCTTNIERINTAWGDMGIPVGSLMVDGQSCGKETKYIQSNAPETIFDWEFYSKNYPDLKLTTELQALTHWETTGMAQGLLPNNYILRSMTNLGKIGYVDINTELHTVPKQSHKYSGTYKMFNSANVIGTTMADCSIPNPDVKYGDQIYIKYNNLFANTSDDAIALTFSANKTIFFLRPPPGSDALNGKPIKYGDTVHIAATSSNTNTSDCGWYGCKVLKLASFIDIVISTPGEKMGGSKFVITAPAGSNYENGTTVKYLHPFSFTAFNEYNPVLLPNEQLSYSGISSNDENKIMRKSLNGRFWLICIVNTIVILDTQQNKVIWQQGTKPVANQNGKFLLSPDGNLILFDHTGIPVWSTYTTNKGVPPYRAIIQNDGNFCLYDSKNTYIWGSSSNQPGAETPVIKIPILGIAKKVAANNKVVLSFSRSNPTSSLDNVFRFQNINVTSYDNKCNVELLKSQCNIDPNCTGFIHSVDDNSWQKIVYDSVESMFKITNKKPQVYVKEAKVDMQDSSCLKGTPTFVDSITYMNYPKKYDFIMNGNQCNAVDMNTLPQQREKYNSDNVKYLNSGTEISKKYPDLPEYTIQNENLNNKITKKTKEYKKVIKDIEIKNKSKFSSTHHQQQQDLMVLEHSSKSNSILWGISAIVIIAVVVAMRNRV